MVYPALLPLMRTPRVPAVDWTDAPADLNGLVRFGERRNLVSARVPSHFENSLMLSMGQEFLPFRWNLVLLSSGSSSVHKEVILQFIMDRLILERKKIRRAKKTLARAVVRTREKIQTWAVARRWGNTHSGKKNARYSVRQSSKCGHG